MKIKRAELKEEKGELDQLLWDVLWKPIGLPRDIRDKFKLDKPQIELIAVESGSIIGGLVANWLNENEIELRHIAVKPDYQRLSIGRSLIEELINLVKKDAPMKIETIARNTSSGFFVKVGFESTGEFFEHEDFARHGIKLEKMCLAI